MTKNVALFKRMVDFYNSCSYTHEYMFGFRFGGNIWLVNVTNEILPYALTLDKASRGAGYALRFKPTAAVKGELLSYGATVVCSEELFDKLCSKSKYNKGEVFEKLVTEMFGQAWEKDNIPFTEDGDLTVDGIAYQIKFEKATFINEKQMLKMQAA